MASARIVYASLTGNNEDIAGIIEEAFEDLGGGRDDNGSFSSAGQRF